MRGAKCPVCGDPCGRSEFCSVMCQDFSAEYNERIERDGWDDASSLADRNHPNAIDASEPTS